MENHHVQWQKTLRKKQQQCINGIKWSFSQSYLQLPEDVSYPSTSHAALASARWSTESTSNETIFGSGPATVMTWHGWTWTEGTEYVFLFTLGYRFL